MLNTIPYFGNGHIVVATVGSVVERRFLRSNRKLTIFLHESGDYVTVFDESDISYPKVNYLWHPLHQMCIKPWMLIQTCQVATECTFGKLELPYQIRNCKELLAKDGNSRVHSTKEIQNSLEIICLEWKLNLLVMYLKFN